MDPITRAARTFLAEAEAFWRSGRGHLLPVIAAPSERVEVVKTLRLKELAPDNRRPLFLYEEPFTDPRTYDEGLACAIAEGYELIRLGAEEEGVSLPAFAPEGALADAPARGPLERAMRALERAAALLGTRLDGVLLALLPTRVESESEWRDGIVTLQRTRFSERVRIAVWNPPGGPLNGALGPEGARFHVDMGELVGFLKQLGGGRSAGPAIPGPPAPTEEQRRAFEAATGRRLPSSDAAVQLRAFLLDGGQKTAAHDHRGAARESRNARALCQAEGLVLEEAMVLIALGGACLAAGAVNLAVESYREAAGLAEGKEAWPVACQAWLGAGGAHLTAKRYAAAAVAYRAAAAAARRGEAPILVIEALRMEGTCALLDGSTEDAVAAWQAAVDAGAALGAPMRRTSTLPQVASALVELLLQLGLRPQAEHVRALLDPAAMSSSAGPATPAGPGRVAPQADQRVGATLPPSSAPPDSLPFLTTDSDPPDSAETMLARAPASKDVWALPFFQHPEPPPERGENAAALDPEDVEPAEIRTAPVVAPLGPCLPFRSPK